MMRIRTKRISDEFTVYRKSKLATNKYSIMFENDAVHIPTCNNCNRACFMFALILNTILV